MTSVLAPVETFDPQHFDLGSYLTGLPEPLLSSSAGRRELTRLDPLAFALTYLPHHLRSEATNDQITLSEFHVDLVRQAQGWVRPLNRMKAHRDAYVAPREMGKSTWLFLILPLWAAAHGHLRFIAAFADSATQAEQHLMTFRHELETNQLLNRDFPDLCEPAKGTRVAKILANSRGQIQQSNGFIFMARGIDSAVAGMKVGSLRPQLIILDDVEPDEANYSALQKNKRLLTIVDNILPLNAFARVLFVGTVVMAGSILHEAVQSVTSSTPADWIKSENFRVHYWPAILENDDGTERSIWPAKWPLDELVAMRHTRAFLKNFMNRPLAGSDHYWTPSDYVYREVDVYPHTVLSIDPAVTTKETSDYTGLAVVSRTPTGGSANRPACWVRHAGHVRLRPQDFRTHIETLIGRFPDIGLILIETNQGGDLWSQVLSGLPIKIRTIHQKESKSWRAQQVLNWYQRGQVFHTERFSVLEEEQTGYPNALHDDVLDAVNTAVRYFLSSDGRRDGGPALSTQSYL